MSDTWGSNGVDECRKRAIECVRSAARARDDLLSGAYLQLARHWRVIGQQAALMTAKSPGRNE